MSGWFVNLGLSLLLVQPPANSPPVRDRSEVLSKGEALWDEGAGDMDAVSRHFEQAYRADPQPIYLFARARAEVQLAHCETATQLLEAFLATEPPAAQRESANNELSACESAEPSVDSSPPVPVVAPPKEPATAPAQPAPPEPESREPPSDAAGPRRRPDALGVTLTGFGAAFLAAGAPVALVGRSRSIDPPRGDNEDDYRRSIQSGRTMVGIGIGLSAVGVGLLVAGVTRLIKRRQ